MDIARLVADNRWQAVLDYYHMLPNHSLTREAILRDPQVVEMLASQGLFDSSSDPKTIAISDHTPDIDVLLDILYELRVNNFIHSQGKQKIEPVPRTFMPEIDAARTKSEREEYEELKNFFGG